MAKKASYRWQNEKRRNRASQKRRPAGISNDQAKRLAALQRELGEAYTGAGMNFEQATRAITRLQRKLEERTGTHS